MILGGIIFCVYEVYISIFGLICTHYEIFTEKINTSIRIVQLSDLHNNVFGSKNEKLIELVNEQSPDLILMTGDMLNMDKEDSSIAEELICDLCQIAPVYFSYGNHEKDYEKKINVDLSNLFKKNGAHILEYTYEDIIIKEQKIRMGGLYGYCLPEKYGIEAKQKEVSFLNEFQSTELCTILLCHMPVCWIANDGISEWNVDYVFAGHVHGGQIRLPFVGGLYAPDQGWFPGQVSGVYNSDDGKKRLILSRGLGSSEKIPRFNNIPEIVVVDIVPK